jgi:hypothetical protein
MRKKTEFILLSVLAFALAGCSKVSDLYSANAFMTAEFTDNFLLDHFDVNSANLGDPLATTITLDSDHYANGGILANGAVDGAYTNGTATVSRKGISSLYSDMAGSLDTTEGKDWTINNEGNESSYVGISFGRTKCLAAKDASFKNGVLSKLYNGQLYCDGVSYKSLVMVKESGYTTLFPKTMASGKYFLISMRGGTNNPKFVTVNGQSTEVYQGLYGSLDLQLTFYKKNGSAYDFYNVLAKDVYFQADNSAEWETFFAIDLNAIRSDVPEFDLALIFILCTSKCRAIRLARNRFYRRRKSRFLWRE